jgi:hypothetical protein
MFCKDCELLALIGRVAGGANDVAIIAVMMVYVSGGVD